MKQKAMRMGLWAGMVLSVFSCVGYYSLQDWQGDNLKPLAPCNTIKTAYPQTYVSDMMLNHFNSPLPKGKTVKKALCIGLDGTRADCLIPAGIETALLPLLPFRFYYSYAGGKISDSTLQETRTACGWTTILTGVWARQHGVTNNTVPPRSPLTPSFLERLADLGYRVGVSAAFEAITDNASLSSEKISRFTPDGRYYSNLARYESKDNRVKAQMVEWIDADYDCSFCVFDFTDHIGHANRFSPENEAYVAGVSKGLSWCADLISHVKARETYSSEDWLFLITTDHGGLGSTHGFQSLPEKTTFLLTNVCLP